MAIKCELCGGTEFVKNGGMFVCKKCNTEYSPEEAKKMMGDFEIDSASDNNNKSEELENLYELARRAKNDGNDENALKFYEQILINEPSSWEPNFYTTYFQVIKCKIGEIGTAAVKLKNSEKSVLELLHNDNNLNNEAKINAIKEMSDKMSSICLMLFSGYKNHYIKAIKKHTKNRNINQTNFFHILSPSFLRFIIHQKILICFFNFAKYTIVKVFIRRVPIFRLKI